MLSAEPNSSCGCGKVVWRSERWSSSAFVTIGTHDAIFDSARGRPRRCLVCALTPTCWETTSERNLSPAPKIPSHRGAGTISEIQRRR